MPEKDFDIENKLEELDISVHKISDTLNTVAALHNPENRLFNGKYYFEKGMAQRWVAYSKRPDFFEKYSRLVDGLDTKSIDIVNTMLKRMRNFPAAKTAVFSPEEQEALVKLKYKFCDSVIYIADNVWAYNKYLLPIRAFESCVFFDKVGLPYVKHLDRLQGKAVIDAGAYIGDSAIVFEDYIQGIIFAFEPIPNNFALMQKTIALNKAHHIIPVQKALWSSETTLHMNDSGSGSYVDSSKSLKVEATTLDKFVEESDIEVGLIKTDLEGAELECLKGAEHTIRTQTPTLLISIYHKPEDFFELKPLLQEWVPEYTFKIVRPIFGSLYQETQLIAEIDHT